MHQGLVQISGPAGDQAIKTALERIITAHPVLRTIYAPDPLTGDTIVLVQDEANPEFHVCQQPGSDWAEQLMEKERRELHRMQSPIRVLLVRSSQESCSLIITLSAMAGDAETLRIIYRFLFQYISGDGEAEGLSYDDYTGWQNGLLSDGDEEGSRFWEEYGYREASFLRFPMEPAKLDSKDPFHRYTFIQRRLTANETASLESFAANTGSEIENVLLLAFALVLSGSTGKNELAIGRMFDGRNFEGLETCIGPLAKILPLVLRLDGNAASRQLLRTMEQTWEEVTTYQDCFIWNNQKSIPAAFEYYELPDRLVSTGLRIQMTRIFTHPADCLLRLSCTRDATGVHLYWHYDRAALDATYVQLLDNRLKECLQATQWKPAQLLKDISIVGAAERKYMLELFNDTAVNLPSGETVLTLFEQAAARFPAHPAVSFQGSEWSYEELDRRAGRIAAYLMDSFRVMAGSVIGILMERSGDYISVMLGILKAGAVFLPIGSDWPAERIRYVLENAGASLMVHDMHLWDVTGDAPALCLPSDILLPEAVSEGETLHGGAHPSGTAYILYTSGSTGLPKGVEVTHQSLLNYILWANKYYFNNEPGCSFGCLTPLTFDLTLTSIFSTLLRGDKVVVMSEKIAMSQLLQESLDPANGVEAVKLTPSHVMIMKYAGITTTAVKVAILGGEALTTEQVDYLKSINPAMRIFNEYGPTEATIGCTVKEVNAGESLITIGKPIANARIYILDEQNRPVPLGVPGQLAIGGKVLAAGYVNNAEMTAQKFIADPFKGEPHRIYLTGDVARWLPGGELVYLGRSDTQVKLRGYRIELSEVENVVGKLDQIDNAVVILSGDAVNERLICFYSGTSSIDEKELLRFAGQLLPSYMVPAQWMYIQRWPLTANGKIDKKQLLDYAGNAGQMENAEPSTTTQEKLLQIWKDVLSKKDIGIRHNFFHIGGNSLNAIQVMTEVHKAFNAQIALQDIFAANTVEKLATVIDNSSAAAQYEAISPVEEQPHYEVSRGQRRLWILQEADPSSVAYNMPYAVDIGGPLDTTLWQQCFREITERHEILRTFFFEENGEVRQVVVPIKDIGFEFPITHLQDNDEQDRLLTEAVNLEAARPFDLGRAPLVRGKLLRCSADRHIFLLSMHHIVSDGVSLRNMLNEISEIYTAAVERRRPQLPELTVQYKDFAAWQNRRLQMESYKSLRSFWMEQLQDAPRLELPADKQRPAIKTYAGAVETKRVPAAVAEKLRGLMQQQEITMFMGFVAVVKLLLSRYSGQSDITIGTPVAGRLHADLKHQLGFYVNTLAIRSRFDLETSFSSLAAQVKQNLLDAFRHQAYPFDDLVADLNLASDLSRSPLFDVMVEYENSGDIDNSMNELHGLSFAPLQSDMITSKFDLSFHLNEDVSGLSITIEYNTDIFGQERVAAMSGHLLNLMEQVVGDPSRALYRYPVMPAAEQDSLLNALNDTQADFGADDFIEIFESVAEANPDKPAVQFGVRTLSYGKLNEQANQLAVYLMEQQSVGAGDVVGLLLERSDDLPVTMLAVLKTGAAYLPVDVSTPAKRMRAIFRDAGCTLVLTNAEESLNIPQELRLKDIASDLASIPNNNPGVKRTPQSLAYIIYTSGTTGQPKGVAIPWKALCNYISTFRQYFALTPDDRMIQGASPAFDISVDELYPILATGGFLYISKQGIQDVNEFIGEIREQGITIVSTTPQVIDFLNRAGLEDPALRTVISGGDALEPRFISNLLQQQKVYNTYGPTEATVCATFHQVRAQDLERATIPIGTPISNVQVYILDERLQPVPAGIPGELYIGGAGLAKGYWNAEEITNEKFIDSPFAPGQKLYKTGDMGRWNYEGLIELSGRNDDQVKIRGYRIELREVEQVIARHTSIRDVKAAVIVRGDDKYLAAYMIGDDDLDLPGLRMYLKAQLPAYMIPDSLVRVEEFPLTTNGKLDMKKLPDALGENGAVERNYIPPEDAAQEKLVRIWEEILSQSPISINDNFFSLGGHSLKAVLVVKAIQKEMGCKVLLRDIFNYPTVRELSGLLHTDRSGSLLLNLNNVQAAEANLFMIPPIIGSSTLFRDLAQELNGRANCYGIQYKGFDEAMKLDPSIGAMADSFLAEIRNIQPQGLYTLVGYSMGGAIAFEIARRLESEGAEVELILLDTVPETASQKEGLEQFNEGNTQTELDEWLAIINIEDKARMSEVYNHHSRLINEYVISGAVRGNIHAFHRNDEPITDHVSEWAVYTSGSFEAEILPGTHFDFLGRNREILAERIAAIIRKRNSR